MTRTSWRDDSGIERLSIAAIEDQGTILLNSRVGRCWPSNLLRDPRAALSVEDGDDYVAVRGLAEHLHEIPTLSPQTLRAMGNGSLDDGGL